MAFLKWPDKDPNEVLDYRVDWSERLAEGDEISASTWPDFPAGLTKNSDSFTEDGTVVWIQGGTVGQVYQVTNRVVTSGGRTMDQTMKIKIKVK